MEKQNLALSLPKDTISGRKVTYRAVRYPAKSFADVLL